MTDKDVEDRPVIPKVEWRRDDWGQLGLYLGNLRFAYLTSFGDYYAVWPINAIPGEKGPGPFRGVDAAKSAAETKLEEALGTLCFVNPVGPEMPEDPSDDVIDAGCIFVTVLDDNGRGGQEVVGKGLLPATAVMRVYTAIRTALIGDRQK